MDQALYAALVAAFATLVTVHVALAFGIARRTTVWQGALSLIVPPLAPYWGLESGLRLRSALWLGAVTGYLVLWVLSRG